MMPPSFREELSFREIYQSIGEPVTPERARKAKAQVHTEDGLANLRQAHLERNIHRVPLPEVKQELEKVKSSMTPDLEIMETENDPDDIDVLYTSQAYEGHLCPYSKLV